MTKIVDLQSFRERALEQKSYGPWQKRFGESYGAHTRISDLSAISKAKISLTRLALCTATMRWLARRVTAVFIYSG